MNTVLFPTATAFVSAPSSCETSIYSTSCFMEFGYSISCFMEFGVFVDLNYKRYKKLFSPLNVGNHEHVDRNEEE